MNARKGAEPAEANAEELGSALLAVLRAASGTGPRPGPSSNAHASATATRPRASTPPSPGRPPAVVTLGPIASGLPLGSFGLVAAATITGVQLLGLLPVSASKAIGLLLFATVLVQVIGGISCIGGRDVIAATLMLTFSVHGSSPRSSTSSNPWTASRPSACGTWHSPR